jgi:hypothetical protein
MQVGSQNFWQPSNQAADLEIGRCFRDWGHFPTLSSNWDKNSTSSCRGINCSDIGIERRGYYHKGATIRAYKTFFSFALLRHTCTPSVARVAKKQYFTVPRQPNVCCRHLHEHFPRGSYDTSIRTSVEA